MSNYPKDSVQVFTYYAQRECHGKAFHPAGTYTSVAVIVREVVKMSAQNGFAGRLEEAGKHLARRIPLTLRSLELVAVLALYVAGLVFVDQLTGTANFPVVVYAMFVMPVVLSVGLRWFRTVERRLGLADHRLPHIG